MSLIAPRLWLGSANDARNKRLLARHDISAVLSVEEFPQNERPDRCSSVVRRQHVSMLDSETEATHPGFLAKLERAVAIIHQWRTEEKRTVLLHCSAGKSRSVTVAMAYLMSQYSSSPEAALAQIREARPVANPNPAFLERLRDFATTNAFPATRTLQ